MPLCNSSTPRCAWHAAAPVSICIMSEATEDSLLIPLTAFEPLPFPRRLNYFSLCLHSCWGCLHSVHCFALTLPNQSLWNWAHFLVCKPGVPDRTSSEALLQSQHCVITGLPSSLPPCIDTECVSCLLASERTHLSSSEYSVLLLEVILITCRVGNFFKTSTGIPRDMWAVSPESKVSHMEVPLEYLACLLCRLKCFSGRRVS